MPAACMFQRAASTARGRRVRSPALAAAEHLEQLRRRLHQPLCRLFERRLARLSRGVDVLLQHTWAAGNNRRQGVL